MTPDLKKKRDELLKSLSGKYDDDGDNQRSGGYSDGLEDGFDAATEYFTELMKTQANVNVLSKAMKSGFDMASDILTEKLNEAAAIIERKDRELSKQRQEIETLRGQRDRLAGDALAILSANGIATPEKGYVDEPYMLAIDIKTLARERDSLRAQLAEKEASVEKLRLALSMYSSERMRMGSTVTPKWADEALSPKSQEGGEA